MSDIKIGIQITADSQDAALLELISKAKMVQAELKNTGDAASHAQNPLEGLGTKLKELAVAAGVALGMREIVTLIKDGAREAIAEERAMGALVLMLQQFDKGLAAPKDTIEAFAQRMKTLAMDDDQVIAGLRQLVPITGNYANAASGVSLAWNLTAASGSSYTEMLSLVADLIANKPRSLVRAQELLGEKVKDTQTALDLLFGRFGDYAGKLDDQQMKVDKLAVKWHDLWKAIGKEAAGAILDGIEMAGKLGDKLQWVADSIFKSKALADAHAQGAEGEKHVTQEAIRLHEESLAYFEKELAKAQKGTDAWWDAKKAIDANREALAKLKATEPGGKPEAEAPKANKATGDKKAKEDSQDSSVMDVARAFKALRDAEVDEAHAAVDAAQGKKAIYAATDQLVAALDRQKRAEIDLAKVEEKSKVDAAKGDAAQIVRIHQETALKLQAIDKKYSGAEEKAWKDAERKQEAISDKFTAATKKDEDQRLQVAKTAADKREDVEQKLQDKLDHARARRLSAERSLYGNMMSLASQYGGESVQKVVQVISTIEQLYEIWKAIQEIFFAEKEITEAVAATTAMATTKISDVSQGTMNAELWAINAAASVAAIPYVGWAMAPGVYAAALAAGMASVAAIAAVPMAAGGTLAMNPMVTMIGERGPELVLPNKFTRMFDRMADREATVNNTHNMHSVQRGGDVYMHVYNPIGGTTDNAYKKVERKMRVAKRANDRALANRPVTRIGPRGRVN